MRVSIVGVSACKQFGRRSRLSAARWPAEFQAAYFLTPPKSTLEGYRCVDARGGRLRLTGVLVAGAARFATDFRCLSGRNSTHAGA